MNEALIHWLSSTGDPKSVYEHLQRLFPQLNDKTSVWPVETSSVTISTIESVTPSLIRVWVRRKGLRGRVWRALGELLGNSRFMRRGWTVESKYKSPPIRTETIELQSFGYRDYKGRSRLMVQYHPASDTLYIKPQYGD